ncbi:transglycosylase domain-containing protein [Amphibacillus sediminis]|uniref:transglycosylase domain-containing protein n=1 Tax=Amphibacillus sediminis TaxID=360185 RepID=UPI0008307C07|nr:PBP1A family penicillin-binding protein [Amphibacillus sediminis]
MDKIYKLYNHIIRAIKRPWVKWPALIIVAILTLGFAGFLFIIYGGGLIVDQEALILPATTSVVTEDGTEIGQLYTENRQLVELDQIPDHVLQAFIAVEDERFYQHAGIDFKSVIRAVYRDIRAFDKVEGASTITQQLAKNLFLDQSRSWMRKTQEVMASIYLERHFSKNEILELYLNQVYFGHGINGIGTAAKYFFDKPVDQLTITEGAMLAGMMKGPNLYSPYIDHERALERRNLVLSQLERVGYLDLEEMLTLQGQTLHIADHDENEKPWLDDYLELVIREAEEVYQISRRELQRGGYQITAYMDETAQKIAYQLFQDDSFFHGAQPNIEAAFTMLDHKTGQLKAALGGRDFQIGDHHRALIKQQPGSVIKPLAVYGPALEEGYQPYSLLDDSQQDYEGYSVRNADGQYQEQVSMYEALTVSKNTSAIWLLDQLGIDTSKQYLEMLGLTIPDQGLAIGLGGLSEGLTPIQIAQSYQTFAHGGEWIEAHTIAEVRDRHGEVIVQAQPEARSVFSDQVAWHMLRMLENVVKQGTAQSGVYDKALAGKTGTTQHPHAPGYVKDAWFAGITPEYVTTLWIGYDHSDADHYLTIGSEAPTELTKAILSQLDQKQTLKATFAKPDHVNELEPPIELPQINDLTVSYKFGGWRLIQGELAWTASDDDRVIYYIYQIDQAGQVEQIGQVQGEASFTLVNPPLFRQSSFYVVPYNAQTDQLGNQSNLATLSLRD